MNSWGQGPPPQYGQAFMQHLLRAASGTDAVPQRQQVGPAGTTFCPPAPSSPGRTCIVAASSYACHGAASTGCTSSTWAGCLFMVSWLWQVAGGISFVAKSLLCCLQPDTHGRAAQPTPSQHPSESQRQPEQHQSQHREHQLQHEEAPGRQERPASSQAPRPGHMPLPTSAAVAAALIGSLGPSQGAVPEVPSRLRGQATSEESTPGTSPSGTGEFWCLRL